MEGSCTTDCGDQVKMDKQGGSSFGFSFTTNMAFARFVKIGTYRR